MRPIEALQSAGAWQASIKGALPADLGALVGAATVIPAQLGQSLEKVTNTLKVFQDLSVGGDATSIIGIVVAGIKAIVGSIVKAADQRETNFAEARLWYLGNARGIRVASKLKDFFGGGRGGYWRFPRASVAKDRAIPYWDPLGDYGNMPDWLAPYGWTKPGSVIRWPEVGNWLPRDCTSWNAIGLGATCSGATHWTGEKDVPVPHPTIVCWPWAWPLSSPSRIAGLWSKASKGPEDVVAGLYMLPTPQHIATFAHDVAASKAILLLAMQRWFPKAYEAGPGDWRNTGVEHPTGPWSKDLDPNGGGTSDYHVGAPGVPFTALARALARVHGFEVCRAAILEAPQLLPDPLRVRLKDNPDFSMIGKGNQIDLGGLSPGAAGGSAGAAAAVAALLAALGLGYLATR